MAVCTCPAHVAGPDVLWRWQVGVSLVLSFMVVWDLPTIAAGMRSLQTSRLGPIYNEVAPTVAVFSQLFGKALQAQVPSASGRPSAWFLCTFGGFPTAVSNPWRFVWTQTRTWALRAQARIALINTALTAAGMWALAIPGIGLLSLFVFICSFIPIAGCFISTVPIGFTALTEFGFVKVSAMAQPGFPPANVLYVSTLPSLPADSHNASVAYSYSHASAPSENTCAELWLAVLGSSRW